MKIKHSAQKQLQNMPHEVAINLISTLTQYESEQRGYIKWLEGRPGYRIKIGQHRVIFEFEDEHDEITILKVLTTA